MLSCVKANYEILTIYDEDIILKKELVDINVKHLKMEKRRIGNRDHRRLWQTKVLELYFPLANGRKRKGKKRGLRRCGKLIEEKKMTKMLPCFVFKYSNT